MVFDKFNTALTQIWKTESRETNEKQKYGSLVLHQATMKHRTTSKYSF